MQMYEFRSRMDCLSLMHPRGEILQLMNSESVCEKVAAFTCCHRRLAFSTEAAKENPSHSLWRRVPRHRFVPNEWGKVYKALRWCEIAACAADYVHQGDDN